MSFDQRINQAYRFEDKVVAFFNSMTNPAKNRHIVAGLYGNRLNDDNVQRAMMNDVEGRLIVRYAPDIYLNINGYSFFLDAKTYRNRWTGNHLVDEDSIDGLYAHQEYTQRPTLLAFDHPDGRVGLMSLDHWASACGPIQKTQPDRNSDSDYRLAACECFFALEPIVERLTIVRSIAA